MKTRTLVLAFLAIIVFAGCRQEAKEAEIAIMSFNIRHSAADDGDNSWKHRKEATPAMINTLKPDIIGIQEARTDQIEYIQENCPDYEHYGLGRDDGKSEGETMVVFHKKDKFNVLAQFTFWLSETPEVPSFGWDAACRRTATVSHFEHKESGQRFFHVNTHLDHMGLEAQRKGLEFIVEKIKSINPDGAPLFLGGDLNMIDSNESIISLEGIMLNTRKVAPISDTLATFNGWKGRLEDAALGTNLKSKPAHELIIDYIFYSPRDSSMCRSFRTVTEEYAGIPLISDHYPIISTFKF